MGDLKGHTLRGTAVTVLAQGVKFVFLLIQITVLARLLTPADFGLVAMVTVVTGLLNQIKDGGLSMATVQRSDVTHDQISNLFWINAGFGITLALATVALAPVIASIYSEPRLVLISLVLSASFVINGMGLQHQALLKRQMRFKTLVRIDVLSMALGICTGILAAWVGWGYWSLVMVTLTTSLGRLVFVWEANSWRPGRFRRGSGTRPLLSFGLNLTGAKIIGHVVSNLTSFAIGLVGGAQQLGYYNRASTLMALPTNQVLPPIMNVVQPALCRVATDPQRFRRACLSLVRKVSLLAMLLVVMMLVFADWLVLVFLGQGWERAVDMFRWLALFALVRPIALVATAMLTAAGRADVLMRWKIFTLVITAVSIAIGVHWGVEGIIAGFALSGVFIRVPGVVWVVSRYIPVTANALWRNIGPYLLSAMATAGLLLVLKRLVPDVGAVLGLIIGMPASMVTYLALCWLLPGSRAEIRELSGVLGTYGVKAINNVSQRL